MEDIIKAGPNIKRIFKAYEEEFRQMEEHLKGMFQSEVFLIPAIGRHIIESGGKRLRPLFLLASAKLAGYKGKDHIALASIIESVHTASLLHDDVVDGADVRRGKAAAHSIWGNQTVILVGDFLYSNALKQTVSFKNQDIMETLSAATTRMTQGELLQLQRLADVNITEEEYIEIISSKTAALISAACRIGAILGGCPEEKRDALAIFGMKAGLAFQMADDILDYIAHKENLGKTLGKDLEEGKVTLPVICLLRAVTDKEKESIGEILREDELSEKSLTHMTDLFRRYDVIEEAAEKARKLVEEAKNELLAFPSCQARDDLFELADYALQRDR